MMRPATHRGFVLLEVLPALLVFSVLFLTGMRIYWVRLRMQEAVRRELLVPDAMCHVLRSWQSTGGTAAVSVRMPDGQWEILDFPDESWLPPVEEIESKAVGGNWLVLRRCLRKDASGRFWWDVEVGSASGQGGGGWTWAGRVMEGADPATEGAKVPL